MANAVKRVVLLDGWRAVAIALVLVHHVGQGFIPIRTATLATSRALVPLESTFFWA
jgi:peptidoglycan/LPS O-acetylase OafA/YrhL